jgi:hypothetical protein
MRTELHAAAKDGEADRLQSLLDSGAHDVNEGSDTFGCWGVCIEKERDRDRERERGVDLLSSRRLCAMNNSGYVL